VRRGRPREHTFEFEKMWDWLQSYPWTRIEHIGTPYEPKKDLFYPPEYDYIVVGGTHGPHCEYEADRKAGPQDAYSRIDSARILRSTCYY
jgi:hypothetical protein